ncbi:MAG: metallophosphoesterase [Oscillospiraceae bacterium]|jgi:hypothetical protein|nr:metallophosphoesterase [Oscillospiraceae bacterium]
MEGFTPVLRFIALSDVHYKDDHSVERERMAQALQTGYRFAAQAPDYHALDALAVVGDLADRGTEAQFLAFRQTLAAGLLPATTAILSVASHEFCGDHVAEAYEKLERHFHQKPDVHTVINGFHFISLSPSRGTDFDQAKRDWAAAALAEAAADDPRKPIFFFQHPHIRDTVAGSIDWGNADLTTILMHYPQVIDFSGHSHVSVNDPRSIHQAQFTSLGCGTLSYFDLDEYDKYYGTTPPGAEAAAQMLIVEADAQNRVRITPWDLLNDQAYPLLWEIETPSEPESFQYTRAKRSAAAKAPRFAQGAALCVENNRLTFDQADFAVAPVLDYYVRIRRAADGVVVRQYSLWSDFYFTPLPATLSLPLDGLTPGAEYVAEVAARGFWGNFGANTITGGFTAV